MTTRSRTLTARIAAWPRAFAGAVVALGIVAAAPACARSQTPFASAPQAAEPWLAPDAVARLPTANPGYWRDAKPWLLPAAALGASLLVVEFDDELREQALSGFATDRLRPIAHVFKPLGGRETLLIGAGAYLIGEATGHDAVADVGLHASASLLATGAAVSALKMATGRLRPAVGVGAESFEAGRGFLTNNEAQSFPSGHTAAAFAIAASVSEEAERHWPDQARWLKPALYAAASLVGLSRVLDDAHWTSDVLAGAVIGTVAGRRTVGMLHPYP